MSPLGICEKMKALSFKMKVVGPLIRPSEIGDGRSKIYKFVQDGALIFKFICYLCKKVSPIDRPWSSGLDFSYLFAYYFFILLSGKTFMSNQN